MMTSEEIRDLVIKHRRELLLAQANEYDVIGYMDLIVKALSDDIKNYRSRSDQVKENKKVKRIELMNEMFPQRPKAKLRLVPDE